MKSKPMLPVLLFAIIISHSYIHKATAGNIVADEIWMENKVYKKHQQPIVLFPHKKHFEEYNATCGDCHHDQFNSPLTSIKSGDDVLNCIECHQIPRKAPKKQNGKKLTKQQRLKYHADAIHYNCIGCHREHNKKNKKKVRFKKAPRMCKDCHPKD